MDRELADRWFNLENMQKHHNLNEVKYYDYYSYLHSPLAQIGDSRLNNVKKFFIKRCNKLSCRGKIKLVRRRTQIIVKLDSFSGVIYIRKACGNKITFLVESPGVCSHYAFMSLEGAVFYCMSDVYMLNKDEFLWK